MNPKQTMKEAGYKFHKFLGNGLAVFKDISNGRFEVFAANKNHASWGIKWRGTDWEFCRDYIEMGILPTRLPRNQ
jgi:hypothetical protein